MWEHFLAYKKEVKDNPILMFEQKKGSTNMRMQFEVKNKKDIESIKETLEAYNDSKVEIPLQRPLTFEGFQNWLDDNDIITDVTDYFENKENRYTNYIRICSRIKRNIRQDQIEGGMGGIYNASITQRLNGLIDKKETHVSGGLNVPNLPDIGERK